MGIETGGDQDGIGCESLERWEHAPAKRRFVLGVGAPGRHRTVDGGARTLPNAGFRMGASARIVGILVQAHEENGAIVLEGVLGAVSMVDIPIEDGNLFEPVM